MKELVHIAKVDARQVAFGEKLGLKLEGTTISVATARIHDAIDSAFFGIADLGSPTQKQIALAAKFGYEIARLSRREGDAVVDDILTELNLEAIEDQELAPGVRVRNIHDALDTARLISSIGPDGTVYFRGGNGKRAWARSLRRLDA